MATIRTSIMITDGMSAAFQSMNRAMGLVLSNFEAVQAASHNVVDTASIEAARREINNASAAFVRMEQEIQQATNKQDNFKRKITETTGATNLLQNAMAGVGAAIGVRQVVQLSDTMAQTTARLNLIKGEMESVAGIQDRIFNSAQRARALYIDTAAAVSKMGILAGKAFSNNDEIIAFTELMNKNFVIGGAGIQEQASAMYQLTQAMAAGKLQGDEFRSIMENAPLLAQSIEAYMHNAGVEGAMKDWSADGLLTADVIKIALFSTADEIERRFREMPMTWGQVWTLAANQFLMAMEPVLQGINWMANNWGALEPIVWGVVGAISAYVIASKSAAIANAWGAIVAGGHTAALMMQAAGYMILAAATGEAAFAQKALNIAMLTSPIGWIMLIIGIIITLIAKWVQSVGGLEMAWMIATTNIANFLDSLWAGAQIGAQDFFNWFLNKTNELIDLLNKVPGIDIERAQRWTFGDDAWKAYETRQSQRNNKLNVARAEAANQTNDDWLSNVLNNMNTTLSGIEDNTGSLPISEEDLKYLRDIAERDAINRFTTAEIKVDMSNSFGDIRETADVDGIIDRLATKIEEQMAVSAEGVYT